MVIKININTQKKSSKRKRVRRNNKKKNKLKLTLVILFLIVYLLNDPTFQGFILQLISLFMYVLIGAVIIFIAHKVYRKKTQSKIDEKLRNSNINEIDKMDGDKFEEYLGSLFIALGYDTEVTKTSGDQGADLILRKNGNVIVVQAKRYSYNVGNSAVQEIFTAKNFYGANDAWVVTNSYFTKSAQELAKVNEVKLIDREQLIELSLQSLQIL
ncbi:restriction endonuclease [Bacillus sp. AFS077874]|uniref:restriction endonuclease n=1 Tax=Bacillus sp. AFS077874 TaxID=2033513 RepID=UPI002570E9A5|nr:restriction endonuclease [Bacillus sp. AFS077874]